MLIRCCDLSVEKNIFIEVFFTIRHCVNKRNLLKQLIWHFQKTVIKRWTIAYWLLLIKQNCSMSWRIENIEGLIGLFISDSPLSPC